MLPGRIRRRDPDRGVLLRHGRAADEEQQLQAAPPATCWSRYYSEPPQTPARSVSLIVPPNVEPHWEAGRPRQRPVAGAVAPPCVSADPDARRPGSTCRLTPVSPPRSSSPSAAAA